MHSDFLQILRKTIQSDAMLPRMPPPPTSHEMLSLARSHIDGLTTSRMLAIHMDLPPTLIGSGLAYLYPSGGGSSKTISCSAKQVEYTIRPIIIKNNILGNIPSPLINNLTRFASHDVNRASFSIIASFKYLTWL